MSEFNKVRVFEQLNQAIDAIDSGEAPHISQTDKACFPPAEANPMHDREISGVCPVNGRYRGVVCATIDATSSTVIQGAVILMNLKLSDEVTRQNWWLTQAGFEACEESVEADSG